MHPSSAHVRSLPKSPPKLRVQVHYFCEYDRFRPLRRTWPHAHEGGRITRFRVESGTERGLDRLRPALFKKTSQPDLRELFGQKHELSGALRPENPHERL